MLCISVDLNTCKALDKYSVNQKEGEESILFTKNIPHSLSLSPWLSFPQRREEKPLCMCITSVYVSSSFT